MERADRRKLTDPELVSTSLETVGHLLVGLLDRRGLDPLVVARVADVVDVVVKASTTSAVLLVSDRDTTKIAPATKHILQHPAKR
jgi:hypothetical protein